MLLLRAQKQFPGRIEGLIAALFGPGILGRLPKRPKGADCKFAGSAYVGSNPTPPTRRVEQLGSSPGSYPGGRRFKSGLYNARLAKLADAPASGAGVRKDVRVRVSGWARWPKSRHYRNALTGGCMPGRCKTDTRRRVASTTRPDRGQQPVTAHPAAWRPVSRPSGEIGRRASLRGWCPVRGVPVRVRGWARLPQGAGRNALDIGEANRGPAPVTAWNAVGGLVSLAGSIPVLSAREEKWKVSEVGERADC